ncbi:putative PilO-like pilus assembly protein [Cupriavidus taiwanensis]|uniref:type 4b pilus protein PilO2 n=1 Tax=Cupriavidus taiwanensis TaxID=164546 RepID=UPI000E1A07A0|nr:type 4b pilus protein PilO2 [Cupriavidus taiwanensis]SPA23795.1 putative PilO-like pilus assembly protein [Cupriavidus taiwanensis]
MSVHIVPVGDALAVFGLSWHPLSDTDRERAEARQLFKEFDASHSIRAASQVEVLYGLLPADDRRSLVAAGTIPRNAKLVSPAILLATMPDAGTNLLWAEFRGDSAHMAVVENGVPFPGGDYRGSKAEVMAAAESILAQTDSKFQFFGNLLPDSIPLPLADLVKEGDIKGATLKPASRGVDPKLLLLVALLAVVGAGYGYSTWSKERDRAARLAARAKQQDPQKLYAASLAAALSTAGPPVAEAAPPLIESAMNQEVYEGGWMMKQVVCEASGCTYAWENVGGNNFSLKSAMGGREITASLDGKGASFTVPAKNAPPSLLDPSRLPTMQHFMEDTGSFSQDVRLIGVQYTFTPTEIFGADPAIPAGSIKSPVRAGTFSYTGPLALATEIASLLPRNMTFARVTLGSDSTGPTFNLEGKYYVKD